MERHPLFHSPPQTTRCTSLGRRVQCEAGSGGQGKPIPGDALLLSFVPYAWVIPWSAPCGFGTARGAKHIGDT